MWLWILPSIIMIVVVFIVTVIGLTFLADALMQRKEYQGAEFIYSVLGICMPLNTFFVFKRGMACYANRHYSRAIVSYQRALKGRDKKQEVYKYLGYAHAALGQHEQAMIYFNQFILNNKSRARIYNARGWSHKEMRKYQAALLDFNRAVELKSDFALAYANRGATYLLLKEYQQALQDINTALEHDPHLYWCYQNRGVIYYRLRKYRDAMHEFTCAIMLNPKEATLYIDRGACYVHLKDVRHALQDYDQAIVLKPQDAAGFHGRGYAYLHINNFEQGRADFKRSSQLDPHDISHAWMVEWCDLCLKKPSAETPTRLEVIATLDATSHEDLPHVCRGTALWIRKKYLEALAELQKALTLRPDSEDAYFWIAVIYASLEMEREAKIALERALKLPLPRILFSLLYLLELEHREFFQEYTLPLLAVNVALDMSSTAT